MNASPRLVVRMARTQTASRAFAEISHELALWMITLADTKASILTAASAGLAGLLFLQPVPACDDTAKYAFLVAVVLALSSTFACLEAVFPRTASNAHASLLYYRAIRSPSETEYPSRVSGLSEEDADREVARETRELAGTQQLKYMWLKWAVVLFASALVPASGGFVWAHLPCAG